MSCSFLCARPFCPSRSTSSPRLRAYTCLAIRIFCKSDRFSVGPILMHTFYQNTLPSRSHRPSPFFPPAAPPESSWDLSPCHLNFQIPRRDVSSLQSLINPPIALIGHHLAPDSLTTYCFIFARCDPARTNGKRITPAVGVYPTMPSPQTCADILRIDFSRGVVIAITILHFLSVHQHQNEVLGLSDFEIWESLGLFARRELYDGELFYRSTLSYLTGLSMSLADIDTDLFNASHVPPLERQQATSAHHQK